MPVILLSLLEAERSVVELVLQWQDESAILLERLLVDVRQSDFVAVDHIFAGMLPEPAVGEHV